MECALDIFSQTGICCTMGCWLDALSRACLYQAASCSIQVVSRPYTFWNPCLSCWMGTLQNKDIKVAKVTKGSLHVSSTLSSTLLCFLFSCVYDWRMLQQRGWSSRISFISASMALTSSSCARASTEVFKVSYQDLYLLSWNSTVGSGKEKQMVFAVWSEVAWTCVHSTLQKA